MSDQKISTLPTVSEMVDRFLGWKLPRDFAPDAGISFKKCDHPDVWPSGTNLFHAGQAKEMIQHMLGGFLAAQPPVDDAHVAPGCELFSEPSKKKPAQIVIEPGTIVKLKSGGPDMVVGETAPNGDVKCRWWCDADEIRDFGTSHFHPACLKIVTTV